MAEMKTLNGHEIVDAKARERLDTLEKEGVGGGGGDVSTGAMQAAIAAAIQEHNEQIQVHQNRLDPMAAELLAVKQTVSAIPKFKIEVVTVHPTITEASTTTVYLVPSGGADGNLYTEWICVEKDGARTWEKLGTQNLDLTGYVTDEELSAAVAQALLIAKESGEFKGETGATGPRGPQGPAYTLTETDKALIVAQVIESLGGNPIFGYVDEENNIIVQGNLGDGTYSVKYEMEDGSTVDIGNLVLDTNVYYSITKNLTNCTISNSATQVVAGGSYSATITANSGYTLDSVIVTMGGSAVSVSGGVISIASVTGDIVITAVAKKIEPDPEPVEPTNFAVPNTTNKTDWSIWCNDARFGSDGAYRALVGNVVTNYVAMEVGDIIRFTGLNVPTTGSSMNQGMHFSDVDKAMLSASYLSWYKNEGYLDITATDGVYEVDTAKLTNHSAAGASKYFRISGGLTGTVNDVVINVKRNGTWL